MMRNLYSTHGVLRQQLDRLYRIQTLLEFESQQNWPEIRSNLCAIQKFFSSPTLKSDLDDEVLLLGNLNANLSLEERQLIEEIADDNSGLKNLSDLIAKLVEPWL